MARKYTSKHIQRKTKELIKVEIPNNELVAKYICLKSSNLEEVLDALIKLVSDENIAAGTRLSAIELLLNRVLGPVSQQGIAIETGEEGIKFQWLSSN